MSDERLRREDRIPPAVSAFRAKPEIERGLVDLSDERFIREERSRPAVSASRAKPEIERD